MAKHIFLALLFCAFFLGFNENLSANILKNIENQPINQELCTLPPPDNFRIASLSPNSVTLAWNPIGSGLTHQIKLYKKVSIGDWILVNTVNNAPGTEITINGLDLSVEHRASIATNCSENDPSLLRSDIDKIVLIIDLTLEGRTPINPTIFEGSGAINYESNNWVGFSITAPGTPGSGAKVKYFEVDEGIYGGGIPIPLIKRVGDFWLVASDFWQTYPQNPAPTVVEIQGLFTFEIYHVENMNPLRHVGTLLVDEFDPILNTIKIKKLPLVFWDPKYAFQMLTATEAMFSTPIESRDEASSASSYIFKPEVSAIVQSPINESLTISFPDSQAEIKNITIELFNTSGQLMINSSYKNILDKILIPIENLPAGLYIVRIEIDGVSQLAKVVKNN